MRINTIALTFLAATPFVNGFSGNILRHGSDKVSRRDTFGNVAHLIGGITFFPALVGAEPTDETPRVVTRMGGLLVSMSLIIAIFHRIIISRDHDYWHHFQERYQDSGRGLSLLVPSGWNKFEGEVGAYDLKWQDLVDPKENVKISSTPVKSTTTSM